MRSSCLRPSKKTSVVVSGEHPAHSQSKVINPSTETSLGAVNVALLQPLTFPRELTIRTFAIRTIFNGQYYESDVWLPFAISQTGRDDLATDCFAALSHVAFGRAYADDKTERDGACMYGKVLVRLNEKLRSHESARTRDTLASVAIMGVYKV